VEVRSLDQVLATLDGKGSLEGLPFMPEMARHCARRYRVQAVLPLICGGGRGMRAVRGAPLVLLDQLRCTGESHGDCHRACTLLWKPEWLAASSPPRDAPAPPAPSGGGPGPAWSYPTRDERGNQACQATDLKHATLALSRPRKIGEAIANVGRGDWTFPTMVRVYLQTVSHKAYLFLRKLRGSRGPTPVEALSLAPGDWVQVKPLADIAGTLDRFNRNRGLEFSRYMIPFCGGTFRVSGRIANFIDEGTGEMRTLRNTVLLEGVSCAGETTSGICRRSELLYWREIWLRRVPGPPPARPPGAPTSS
jgi:hypothetical protein